MQPGMRCGQNWGRSRAMDCNEASRWLDAYIDGELEPERAGHMEAHTRSCHRCAALVDERRRLRDTLTVGAEYHAAPASVRAAGIRKLGLADRPPGRGRAPTST